MKTSSEQNSDFSHTVTRRRFMGGLAATIAYLGLRPDAALRAQSGGIPGPEVGSDPAALSAYDAFVKLSFNENPYGPPESVIKAMTHALKYANRYAYPDGGILGELAAHHGVKPENIILGAGSTEILGVIADTFLQQG